MAQIFISHSSDNNAEAVAMRDWLYANGWNDLFLDLDPRQGIRAGERWQDALKSAAERCEAVIFLISPQWAASKWCLAEFLLAKNLNKRLIGVVIKSTPFEDLPTEMTSEWQVTDLTSPPLSAIFEVKLPGGDQTATVALSDDGLERLRIGLQSAGLDASYFAWPPEGDPDRPPYRGLMPLEAEDAGIFFGRDGAIVEAIDRLRGLREFAAPRLMVILGASGAGKSSFLRAGLLPRLARDDRHFLPLPVIRPERATIAGETGLVASLTAAFKERGPAKNRAAVRTAVDGGVSALRPLLEELVQTAHQKTAGADAPGRPPSLIVPIDQGEELYLAEGAGEADQLLTILKDLVSEDNPAVTVLFTIRSDAYERFQLDHRLEGVRQHTLSLAPMPRGAYVDVITGPPRRLEGTNRALRIEEHLTDALLRDIEDGGGKDALPLLAFTLERLYAEYGDDGDLKLSEYEALGRIRGSIESAIERALEAADADPAVPKDRQARLALLRRGLIPWLAGIDPDTGSPRRRVARLSEIPVEARPLIEHLVEQRLLATDVSQETGETTVEPAHEALLRQWGLLEGWLEEDFEALTTLEGVKRAARDWQANDRDAAWLVHAGGRLEAAERVASREDFVNHLRSGDQAYLGSARIAENARLAREQQTRRVMMFGSVAAIVVLALLGAVAFWNWIEAEEQRLAAKKQRNDALRSQSLYLAEQAHQANEQHDYVTGLLLALEALPDEQSGRDRPLVGSVVPKFDHSMRSIRELHVLAGHNHIVDQVLLNDDGTVIWSGGRDGTVRLWSRSTGKPLMTIRNTGTDLGVSLFRSPDGSRVVVPMSDLSLSVRNASTGKEITRLVGHADSVSDVAFSESGTMLATSSRAGRIVLWNSDTGSKISEITPIGTSNDAENGLGDDEILSGLGDGGILFVEHDSKIVFIDHAGLLHEWTLTESNTKAAKINTENRIELEECSILKPLYICFSSNKVNFALDLKQKEFVGVIDNFNDFQGQMWIDYDNKRVFLFGLTSNTNDVRDVDADIDEYKLSVLDLESGSVRGEISFGGDYIEDLDFHSNKKDIFLSMRTGRIQVVDTSNFKVLSVYRGHSKGINSLSYDPNSSTLVTGSSDGTVRVWQLSATHSQYIVAQNESGYSNVASNSNDNSLVLTTFDGIALNLNSGNWFQEHKFSIKGPPGGLNIGPSGKYLAVTLEGKLSFPSDHVTFFDLKSGEKVGVVSGSGSVFGTAFHRNGDQVAVLSYGSVGVWDLSSMSLVWRQSVDEVSFWGGNFSKDGDSLITWSSDDFVRLWLNKGSASEVLFHSPYQNVHLLDVSPDNKYLLFARYFEIEGYQYEEIISYDLELKREVARIEVDGDVNGIAFHPSGRKFVTLVGTDAIVWETHTGAKLAVLRGHSKDVTAAEYINDGSEVVTVSLDGLAIAWKIYEPDQNSIEAAKLKIARCLSREQRESYFLSPVPPDWCIDMRKWPYDTDEWRTWLQAKRAGGVPEMPN